MIKQKENIVWEGRVARRILIYLNKGRLDYMSRISREIDTCFGNASRTFKELKEEGLIQIVFKGKNKLRKYPKLTEKGRKIAELLLKINEELK